MYYNTVVVFFKYPILYFYKTPDEVIMYSVDKKGDLTISEYLYRCIKEDIMTGKISSGEKLSSKRALAASCGVSLTSVQNAYDMLLSEGYIRSEYRKGYFAERVQDEFISPQKAQTPSKHSSSKENNDKSNEKRSLFPFSVWSRLMRSVISEYGDSLLDRMPIEGVMELRCEISNYLYRSIGISVSPDRIIIAAGTEYLCTLILTLLGRTKIYAVEDPGYKKIPTIYSLGGAPVRYIPTDLEGVKPEALFSSGASVLHISPQNHFPTGCVMTITRRQKLLSWLAESEGRYIIEDDFDSELRLSGRRIDPLLTIDPTGRVIYMNTFTSTVAPSFRVGYLVLPEELSRLLHTKAGALSCTVAAFEQYTLAKFIGGGHFERYINRCRSVYKKKKNNITDMLGETSFQENITILPSVTGTNLLIKFKDLKNLRRVYEYIKEKGFAVSLADFCKNPVKDYESTFVINYSDLEDDDIIKIKNYLKEVLTL